MLRTAFLTLRSSPSARATLPIRCHGLSQPLRSLSSASPGSSAGPGPGPTAKVLPNGDHQIGSATYTKDSWTNVTPHLLSKIPRSLHRTPHHPVNLIAQRIAHYWQTQLPEVQPPMKLIDDLPPVVTTKQNFDDLLFPPDHPGRSVHDSYYLNQTHLLRTHTSAHQTQSLRAGHPNFLLLADCYRRDEIDASHYPVFHQMEGFRTFNVDSLQRVALPPPTWTPEKNPKQACHDLHVMQAVAQDLTTTLEGLCRFLFGPQVQLRWNDDYFPFTAPSWELEVYYQGKWMEVLGSGVVQQPIIHHATGAALMGAPSADKVVGWAFGLGLERLAMVMFGIPDIRLFWSTDARFLDQFKHVDPTDPKSLVKFKPFSAFPPCYKDLAFWIPHQQRQEGNNTEGAFVENALFDLVRDVAGDLVENVVKVDTFVHPKTGRESRCFRIMYRSMDRNVTNDEINRIQEKVRRAVADELKVELR